jgi:hypothetical protein
MTREPPSGAGVKGVGIIDVRRRMREARIRELSRDLRELLDALPLEPDLVWELSYITALIFKQYINSHGNLYDEWWSAA